MCQLLIARDSTWGLRWLIAAYKGIAIETCGRVCLLRVCLFVFPAGQLEIFVGGGNLAKILIVNQWNCGANFSVFLQF